MSALNDDAGGASEAVDLQDDANTVSFGVLFFAEAAASA